MGACFVAWGCGKPASLSTPIAPPPRADVVLRGVTLRNYQGSDLHLTATAPRMEVMRMSTDLVAQDVAVRLQSGVTVTGHTVRGNGNEGHIEGHDGVTFVSPDGVTGRAPSATYEKNVGPQGSAHGEEGVQLDHPRFALEAQGFSVDFASQHATFDRAVTTTKAAAP